MAMIECSHLTMGYGSQIAVEDLSFSVEEGDYLCIVGPNGSGKSTLLKGLLGLAQPKSGSISYHGVSPREIGYLPQQTPVQRDFPASVWEVVLSGCIGSGGWKPFYTAAQKDRAAEMLRRIGAESLCRRSLRALSGGQRQRVLLARALCAADRLLLLDEPTAALDPRASAELYDMIDHLNRRHKVTVLMVSHDLASVRRANKVLQMATSRAFFGGVREYFESAALRRLEGGENHA